MLKRRTDLALEAAQPLLDSGGPGVRREERRRRDVPVTVVEVQTPAGAQAVGKPMGRYVTLDLGPVRRREEEGFRRAVETLSEELGALLPPGWKTALVVCLGNRNITPDALGPLTQEHLLVTRHLVEAVPEHFGSFRPVAALSAGVLGATGVESSRLARAVAGEVSPDVILAVDALAARGVERLCATVQLTDVGIAPGSGVGNCREALNRETLGAPVIGVGMPTVADAQALCADVLEEAGQPQREPAALPADTPFFVTPRDIDQRVAEAAKVIGYAIDLALQPGLSLDDLTALLE